MLNSVNSPQSPASTPQTGSPITRFESPVLTQSPNTPRIANRLSGLLGGLNLSKLFKGLHALFGQGRIVLVGSAAKALHAAQMDDTEKHFRQPNDIDLVISAAHLELAPLHNPAILEKYGLSMPDQNRPHVLQYQDGEQSIKIDLVSSQDSLFRKAFEESTVMEGLSVTTLDTLYNMDRSRLLNGEGNQKQLNDDLQYFKAHVAPKPASSSTAGRHCRASGALRKIQF